MSRYANNEAMNYFARGIELADRLPQESKAASRAMLLQKRAQALTALGRLNEAGKDYLLMREACRLQDAESHFSRAQSA